jgi:hypothetical protein
MTLSIEQRSTIMLSVTFYYFTGCHYAECRYADCRCAADSYKHSSLPRRSIMAMVKKFYSLGVCLK